MVFIKELKNLKKSKLSKILIGAGVLCISIAVLVAVLLNTPNKNSYFDKINSMEASGSASFMHSAESVDELIDISDLIIEGKVVDYEARFQDGMVFTDETVEVKKVIKGNVTEGEKIIVVFTGGDFKGNITHPINDCPIMDMRGNYMLFLKTNDGKDYFIIGGNQGFGLIKNNKIEATQIGSLGDEIRSKKVDEMEKNIEDKTSKTDK